MILDWFAFVASDYKNRLAAENMPTLADPNGLMLLGPENASPVITSAAPRCTLVPLGGRIIKKVPSTPPFNTPAYKTVITQPWIWTDVQAWRADFQGVQYVGGQSQSALDQDWDYTAAMMYVFIQSMHELGEGSWLPSRYEWADSKPRAGGPTGGGMRMVSLWFDVYTPVLLYNLQAPDAIAGPALGLLPDPCSTETTINFASGSAGDAIEITTPT
jgi:hypothetical protein